MKTRTIEVVRNTVLGLVFGFEEGLSRAHEWYTQDAAHTWLVREGYKLLNAGERCDGDHISGFYLKVEAR
jgi:hypothetical protein